MNNLNLAKRWSVFGNNGFKNIKSCALSHSQSHDTYIYQSLLPDSTEKSAFFHFNPYKISESNDTENFS